MKRLVVIALTLPLLVALLFAVGCKRKHQTKTSYFSQPTSVRLA
ncbi:MAG: hypothetical protein NZ805_05360 [Armatimonadetes bacterium]|nr:hypothetical protein [Armatimonadota bacterium]MDW8028028.1 hypothetical protein [Armatimonadota bacterium]